MTVPPASPENRRMGERRQLVDRRAPFARRSGLDSREGERRSRSTGVQRDNRSGGDRRGGERRTVDDRRAYERRRGRRRRETPFPYTAEHVAAIQKAHATPRVRPTCPLCGGAFSLGRVRRRGSDLVRQVRCTSCGKTAVVTNSRTARVLVIAEQAVVRETMGAILGAVGHEVIQAADAAVGLWAYGREPADVVFIDVFASGRMEANEFIRHVRREDPDARVVAMAGRRSFGFSDPLALAKQLGAVGTLRVPFSHADILRVLEEARQ